MADGGSDVKGKKIAKEDDEGLPSLEKHLEGMTLQGERWRTWISQKYWRIW